jgi:hypothetical protein
MIGITRAAHLTRVNTFYLGHRFAAILKEFPRCREMIQIGQPIERAVHVSGVGTGEVRGVNEFELDLAAGGIESISLERGLIVGDAIVGEHQRGAVEMVRRHHGDAAWHAIVRVAFDEHSVVCRQLENRDLLFTVRMLRFPRSAQRLQPLEGGGSVDGVGMSRHSGCRRQRQRGKHKGFQRETDRRQHVRATDERVRTEST